MDSAAITTWGREVFGPADDLRKIVDRAQAELDELRAAVATDADISDIAAEAADVTILLHRLMGELGQDLSEAVAAKMQINRARRWTRAGDGTGQHR